MALTTEQAKQILRIDGSYNNDLINSLIAAIPYYIEASTGMSIADQDNEPMVYTASAFLLQLWYFGEHSDVAKLNRTIDSLLFAISLKAKYSEAESVGE